MGFWPYFLHEYSSAGISAVFELVAGTLIVLFTLSFLRLEQWQRPPEPDSLPERSSESSWSWSCSWHLFLCDEEDRGGFPEPEELAGGMNIPCPFPPETLPSPVIDDMKDDEEDMLKDDKSTPPDLLLLLQLLLLLPPLLFLFFETPRERKGICCDCDCDCGCNCDGGCDLARKLLGFVKSKVRD